MKIKRRDFLKLLGGASGGVALAAYGCDQYIEVPDKLIQSIKSSGMILSSTSMCLTLRAVRDVQTCSIQVCKQLRWPGG